MTQRILGSYGPTKGVSKEDEWHTHIHTIQHQFKVVNQPIQRERQFFGIISEAVPPHIGSNDAHSLPKKTQLVEPLSGASAITVDEDEGSSGIIWMNVDNADATL